MERAILHSDLNCFYASVEMMLNPMLRGKAVAVCGSTEDRHGIVLAKSEKAKKAGVKTGMVNWEARSVCKDLIVVPPQYDQYLKYSKLTRAIYQRYTDLIEPFGMDECWLDVTGSRIMGDPMTIAESIRKTVREELGLTVSIGVSFNKIFAKLGSDMKKPDSLTDPLLLFGLLLLLVIINHRHSPPGRRGAVSNPGSARRSYPLGLPGNRKPG